MFTSEREVIAMLDMVRQETERIDSRFLEPACGDGNFLSEVLRRKLDVVDSRYRRLLPFDTTLSDFEYMAMAQQESMVAPNGLSSQGANAKNSTGASGAESSGASRSRPMGASRQSDSTQVGNTLNQVRTTGADIRRDWIADELDDSGTEYVDKRSDGGCLGVIDKMGAVDAVKRLNGKGAGFRLSQRGERATGGRSAWWLKGYPEESSAIIEPTSIVTELELDNLEIGDTLFHKAFGYGRVVRLGDSYIEVAFENDNHKKKPSRRFMFPGSFYQGRLRIG